MHAFGKKAVDFTIKNMPEGHTERQERIPIRGASIYDVSTEGGGVSRNAANLRTNSVYAEFADREGRGAKKYQHSVDVICGRP